MAELFVEAGAPPGAAVFVLQRDDGEDLFFTPLAAMLAKTVLHDSGGATS